MGLRECANENNLPVPDIFADESYKTANHFTLSTSQVSSQINIFLLFTLGVDSIVRKRNTLIDRSFTCFIAKTTPPQKTLKSKGHQKGHCLYLERIASYLTERSTRDVVANVLDLE